MAMVELLVVIIVAPLSLAATSSQGPAVKGIAAAGALPRLVLRPRRPGGMARPKRAVKSTTTTESAGIAFKPQRLEALVAPVALPYNSTSHRPTAHSLDLPARGRAGPSLGEERRRP